MKITDTTLPKPPRTFSIDLTEAELFHIALILGSMTSATIGGLYKQQWRTDTILGIKGVEVPYNPNMNSQIYGVCDRSLKKD